MIELTAPEFVEFRIGDSDTVYKVPRRECVPFALVDMLDTSGETLAEKAKAVQAWMRMVIDHYNGEGVSGMLDARGLETVVKAVLGQGE